MTTLTDRYVTAMLSCLPQARRADLERELRTSIADAVDGRIAAGEDVAAAEYAALRDLGDPARLAAGYADRPQYLVGPRYYFDYMRLLKTLGGIVLPIVAVAVALAQALNDAPFGTVVGTAAGATISTAAHLFLWVTVAFVAIERGAIRYPLPPGQAWTPDALPAAPPSRRSRFGELIAVTVVTVIFTVALLLSPYVSPVRDANDQPIGPLDPRLWETGAVYGFVALALIGLGTRYMRFYLPWKPLRATAIVLVDVAGAAAMIWAGSTRRLVSPAFAEAAGWEQVAVDWAHRGIMIAGAIVVVTSLLDALTDYRRRGLSA